MSEFNELADLARKATQGPWQIGLYNFDGSNQMVFGPEGMVARCEAVKYVARCDPNSYNNSAFIAAASPDVVLSLVTERDALQSRVSTLETALARVDELCSLYGHKSKLFAHIRAVARRAQEG